MWTCKGLEALCDVVEEVMPKTGCPDSTDPHFNNWVIVAEKLAERSEEDKDNGGIGWAPRNGVLRAVAHVVA